MTTSISKQLKSYFNNIEFIKNGKELSIKPIDVSNNWENFEGNLFQLMETIKIENVKTLIPTFINYRDKQEREFKVLLELKKYLAEKKYDKISVSDAKDYIVKSYSYNTDLKILNWNIAETLNISESFVTEFISLMNFRLRYTRIIVSNLEGMVNTPLITEPQQTFKESENIESEEPEKFDSNNWNEKCFNLFNYLCDKYKMKAKTQKYTNIWFYLEYNTEDDYVFNFPKEDYKLFITDNIKFDFSRAKMNKPNNYETQLTILNNHYIAYCNKLKALK